MATFLITTTGTLSPVVFDDLGARQFTHPTTNFNLTNEYTIEEIRNSDDLAAALDAGHITAEYDGISVADSTDLTKVGAGDMTKSDYDLDGNGYVQYAESLNDGTNTVTALEARNFIDSKGQVNGLASLDGTGKIPSAQIPSIAITDVYVVADIAARDALTGIETGDVIKVTDASAETLVPGMQTYIWDGTQWIDIQETSDVVSVNGQTGEVVLDTDDVNEGATNLYFTEARVLNTLLTGLIAGTDTPITATDSVLSAFENLQAQIDAVTSTADENIRDVVGALLVDTTTVNVVYTDNNNNTSTIEFNVLKVPNQLSAGTGITAFTFDGSATATVAIANTTVTAGSYGSASSVATVAVNAQGQLTAASSVTIDITASQVSDFSEAVDDRVSSLIQNSDSIVWTYNDGGNTLTAVAKKTWAWGGARNSTNVTNSHLNGYDAAPTNLQPYVAPYACKIRTISFSTNAASTWTAQVRVNGVAVASLASGGAQFGQTTGLNVSVAQGDRVSFYVSGTTVNRPHIEAIFEEA